MIDLTELQRVIDEIDTIDVKWILERSDIEVEVSFGSDGTLATMTHDAKMFRTAVFSVIKERLDG